MSCNWRLPFAAGFRFPGVYYFVYLCYLTLLGREKLKDVHRV